MDCFRSLGMVAGLHARSCRALAEAQPAMGQCTWEGLTTQH